jgi:hypothetical protein
MTRARVTIAMLTTSILVGCGGPKRGGGPPGIKYSPKDRGTLVVLIGDNASCTAVKLDVHRANRKDKVIWRVYNACPYAENKEIKIVFTDNNSPEDPNEEVVKAKTIRTTPGNKWTELRLTVKGPTDLPDDGRVKVYEYDFYLGGNKLADPRLEIDPYS